MVLNVLFDKSIEERETQAAESWRIRSTKVSEDRMNSGDLCVSAITKTYAIRGNLESKRLSVKVPVTQRFLGLTSKLPES